MPDLLHDAAWFPHRVEWRKRRVRLVRVGHAVLADSPFLDARAGLADGAGEEAFVGLEAFATLAPERPAMRWIFHEGFCGSTLLGAVLSLTGAALCLREPQILIDLGSLAPARHAIDPRLEGAVRAAVLAKLGQAWRPGEEIVIKASNWVTPIVPVLWDGARGDRATLVRGSAESLVVAVLRGGPGRIGFIMQLYRHLAAARPDLSGAADALLGAKGDGLARALRLVVLVHWLQERLLAEAALRSRASLADVSIGFPDFLDDMAGTTRRLLAQQALSVPDDVVADALAQGLARHSKTLAPGDIRAEQSRADDAIRRDHADAIGDALRSLEALDRA